METQTLIQKPQRHTVTTNPHSRVRKEIRICKHPACGEKFEGSPTSLYCLEHRTRKSRTERFVPRDEPDPEMNNVVIQQAGLKPEIRSMVCALEGCGRPYQFTLYPDRALYPMYCDEHRSEHKRQHFLRMKRTGHRPSFEKSQFQKWSNYESDFEAYALSRPLQQPFERETAPDPQ